MRVANNDMNRTFLHIIHQDVRKFLHSLDWMFIYSSRFATFAYGQHHLYRAIVWEEGLAEAVFISSDGAIQFDGRIFA